MSRQQPGRAPVQRRGFTASIDFASSSVELYFGEALVYRWLVDTRERGELEGAQWRVDRFVAGKLAAIFQAAETYAGDTFAEDQP